MSAWTESVGVTGSVKKKKNCKVMLFFIVKHQKKL